MNGARAELDQAGSGRRTGVALLVAATFFMENLDGTVIATALPAMARSFHTRAERLNIGMSVYLVTLGIFIPASGWLSERFGPRRIFGCAIALFTAASVLCGLVDRLDLFLLARILQGIGGAMMVPVGRLIVLRTTPKDQLINAIATLTWPALIAPILGPPIGGFIVDHASWRWIFYLNLPLGIIALATVVLLVPREPAQQAGRFDWVGFLLTGFGTGLCVAAIEMMGRPVIPWAEVAACAGAGPLLLAASVRLMRKAAPPLLDFSGLAIPTFAISIWGGSLFRMAIGAVPFLLPLMLQSAFDYDPFQAGLLTIAVFAGNLAIKPATTIILRRFGFRPVLVVNGLCNAAVLAACGLLTPETPILVMSLILFLGGVCRSIQFTAMGTVAFADIPQDGLGGANTLFSTVIQLTLGLGIAAGALALRTGQFLLGPTLEAYHVAFALIGLIALFGVADSLRLSAGAGDGLTANSAIRPKSPAR